MKRLQNHLWILYIFVQQMLYHGKAQVLKKDSLDPLDVDEGYLIVSNINYSQPVLLMYNMIVCEHCDFDVFPNKFSIGFNQTYTIGTRYSYDFQVVSDDLNGTVLCQIKSYRFAEHGGYLFEILETNQNQSLCTIIQTMESSYYWLPIIIAVLIMVTLVIVIQLARHMRNSRYFNRILMNIGHQRLINEDPDVASDINPITNTRNQLSATNRTDPDDIRVILSDSCALPIVEVPSKPFTAEKPKRSSAKRLHSLDTFRGFSLMVMIFVNYGGGSYWFFNHSVWNGLTLADLVFPWFTWMMGTSIVLSQRSLLKKKVPKRSILLKICRRTVMLFLFGLILQGGHGKPEDVRILGVLQRLALCYFFTAIIVLTFNVPDCETNVNNESQTVKSELSRTVFRFWQQWLVIILITVSWILITFVPKLPDCPRGYVGPGGKHEHGKYQNCTGGIAGYLDRVILGNSHMYNYPTCRDIYQTQIPYDPEGLLGILTGTFLCYLGVHAGNVFAFSTSHRRTCIQWTVSGLICGFFGLLLSKGGHSDSWIPINKNLWSLTFIFTLAALAFIILTILFLAVDVYKVFTGEPFLWLGMNSIVIYIGHEVCSESFPIRFEVNNTHASLLALDLYGVLCWTLVAGIMYFKGTFIAI